MFFLEFFIETAVEPLLPRGLLLTETVCRIGRRGLETAWHTAGHAA
jgi:hypothetical protein